MGDVVGPFRAAAGQRPQAEEVESSSSDDEILGKGAFGRFGAAGKRHRDFAKGRLPEGKKDAVSSDESEQERPATNRNTSLRANAGGQHRYEEDDMISEHRRAAAEQEEPEAKRFKGAASSTGGPASSTGGPARGSAGAGNRD